MSTVAIHQPQYLPWLPYLAKASSCDIFVFLDNVQFQKNGVQNRNQIKMANGPGWLTVPVRSSLDATIKNTPIDNSQLWSVKHLKSIENAYSGARHKYLIDDGLRQILMNKWLFLSDLNIEITRWMFELLDIRCKLMRSSELGVNGAKDDLVIDICQAVGARQYLSGEGARSYQDQAKFDCAEIELKYQNYDFLKYPQCFPKQGFLPAMSGLDLILNLGDRSRDFL